MVGHLTRNIKISPGPDYGWGFRILVYRFLDGTTVRDGFVNLDSVELYGCGQYDTTNACLDFQTVQGPAGYTSITNSAIHSGGGYGININQASGFTITNNVIARCTSFLVNALTIQNFTFTGNLLIGAMKRTFAISGIDPVACF